MTQTTSAQVTMLDTAPRDTRYIPTLDGWRAVAIVVVMLQHSSDEITRVLGSWAEPATSLFRQNGRLGVSVFFAISGFLITSLLVGEWSRMGRVSLSSFYVRRAFRILPPLLVVLAVLGVLGATDVLPIPFGAWLSSLLFVNNYVPVEGSWYLGHFWSLAIEEHFYLIWPALLVALGTRRAVRACIAIIAGIALWRFVDLSLELTAHWTIHYPGRTDTQADGLMWGCLMALIWVDPRVRQRIANVTAGWRWWAMLAALVATQAAKSSGAALTSIQLAVRPILIVLIVVGTVVRPMSVVGRTLELSPVRWLGRISYSLYLWQQLFLVWDGFGVDALEPLQRFPFSVACAIACAVLSQRYIEGPAIRLGRRISSRLRSQPPRAPNERGLIPAQRA